MELGNLNNLGELDFSGNQLSGEIPVSLGAWQSLQYLNASQNNLQGTIPVSVEQMKGLFEGIRGGYASAKKKFPRKTGTAAVRDHGITTRRADAAEPSRCRRTRRG
jgi:hypothetical protein